MSTREVVHMKEAAPNARCEIHDWPTEGLAQRLIDAARARHGKGGIDVCAACIERAHGQAHAQLQGKPRR